MRVVVAIFFVVFALVGCSRSFDGLPSQANGANMQQRGGSSGTFQTIYDFAGSPDGEDPLAGLTMHDGTLYGTTAKGGGGSCSHGCGTVFAIDVSGKERVIYRFKGGSDGANPQASLVFVDGKLYGTTVNGGTGGSGGKGTIFDVTPRGNERVLHRFEGPPDGANPFGQLLYYHGLFYGTTAYGGNGVNGTVFSLSKAGAVSVIYRFGNSPDGRAPLSGLIAVGGAFYGVTAGGGRHTRGTVYSITVSGSERVLYSFRGGSDGEIPDTTLLYAKGRLYGTTVYGGGNSSVSNGTVFQVNRSGKEKVLYRFKAYDDGATPYGGLVELNGAFYGTTYFGGIGSSSTHRNGTIYRITPQGSEAVVYRFQDRADGANPFAGLILSRGALYGTASDAALAYPTGNGTVFAFAP
ncbi:MAG: hypothetical protein JO190_04830 [Candidatus Eremiobacteraeota bacterium]|nr:hypothetical protein [Candidatus Eremiobacteraeota bacterium]MBV8499596.1 hypothetical protein [Candidatus Eremiobacteraeota bacterium]